MLSQKLQNLAGYRNTMRLIAEDQGLDVRFSKSAFRSLADVVQNHADDAAALEGRPVKHEHPADPADAYSNVVAFIPKTKGGNHDLVS